MINFNTAPYYDDFSESKKFVRVLFRPSYAIQARELTQLQTILQNQMGRFGSHIFSNGSRVVDAQLSYETNAVSIKINDVTLNTTTNVTNLFSYFSIDPAVISLDKVKAIVKKQGYLSNRNGVTGLTFTNGNAKLKVVAIYPNTGTESAVVICQEMTGVKAVDSTTYTCASTGKTFTSIASAISTASHYSIGDGVFFVNNLFVFIEKQTIVTSKYDNVASIRVGINIEEYVVTADTDQSLLDPARNTSNYNAVGADRYAVELTLTTKAIDAIDAIESASGINYIDIARINEGVIAAQNSTSTYSILEDTLAKRTYDESGDYTVEQFGIQFKDHPTDGSKFQVGLDAGLAYVRGYEFRTTSTTWLDVDRARTNETIANNTIPTTYGSYVVADLGTGVHVGNLPVLTGEEIDLMSNEAKVGTARTRLLYRTTSTQVRIYLTNISMLTGDFSDVDAVKLGAVLWELSQDTNGNTVLYEADNNSLLFKQNFDSVKTFTNKSFNYMKVMAVTSGAWNVTGGGFVATNISPSAGDQFIAADAFNGFAPYIVIDSAGDVRTISALSVVSGNLTITISGAAPNNCTVYAPTFRSASSARIKTLNTNTVTLAASSDEVIDITAGGRNYYDIQTIVSIKHSAASTVDIKSKFSLDNGQTDNYYGVGKLQWISADIKPTNGSYEVVFTSFDHSNDASGAGYFTVDSYTNVDYADIPSYKSKISANTYKLRDVIDFRPTVSDVDVDVFKNQALPIPLGIGAEFIASYSYYLPRNDKLMLTKDKQFIISKGIPALKPITPTDLSDSMTLYTLAVPAYTYDVKDVGNLYVENKRYTMRDIGKLDSRIGRVEYYTALTLLEKQAKDKNILTVTGVNAYKNGILVDSFAGHSIGDVGNPEYQCSIDYVDQVLRPKFESRHYSVSRVSGGALSASNMITLPFLVDTFVDQPLSSSIVNVTPYDVSGWIGMVTLTPSSDTWFDTTKAPDIIQNIGGANNNWRILGSQGNGTAWNDWMTNWNGRSIASAGINRQMLGSFSPSARTGIESSVNNLGVSASFADRIVSKTVVPFMRQIPITFRADALKPFTTVYAYFDDVRVNEGNVMVTDDKGSITGTFSIPANVKTGTRLFTITDRAPNEVVSSTKASAQFNASGTLTTIQSTRLVTFVDRSRFSRSIDPLAQSFTVNAKEFPNGLFLDSIDTYFFSKAESLPVILQIRPMVNGYPSSSEVIPLSETVLLPDSVNIVADKYNPSVNDRTRFQFSAPIHLPPADYCFVLMSSTTEYQVYMTTMGEKQFGSNNIISKQPHVGSMFKSQNASTWTASQENDLMFRLNKCVFSSDSTDVILTNKVDTQTDTFNYELMYVNPAITEFSSASASWFKRAIPTGTTLESGYTPINTGINLNLTQQYQVKGSLANQLQYKVVLSTSDNNVSPVIELERCNSLAIHNIVNNPVDKSDELTYGSSLTKAKYVTKPITLATGFESVGLNVTFDAYLPSISDVLVYYKTTNTGNATDFVTMDWVLLSDSADASQIEANRLDTDTKYIEYSFKTKTTLPLFNLYSIKLVMVGDDLNVPNVKDLRVIAFS